MQFSTASNVTITPDGRRVVYLAGPLGNSRIYVRSLDSLVSTPVGTGDGNVFELSMSPDGQWVGFFTPGGIFKRVSLDSGTHCHRVRARECRRPTAFVALPGHQTDA